MLKKYEYEEFLSMVKQDLENQEKSYLWPLDFPEERELIPPVKDKKIIDTVYRLLSVCSNFYNDVPRELDDKYNMWLWSRAYKQIEVLFPDLKIEQVLRLVRYVRTKFIYDEIKRIKTNTGDLCSYLVYSNTDGMFASDEWCPRIFLQQTWVEEDDEIFYYRILPSSMGFFSCQVKEEDVFPKKVSSDSLTFHEVRALSGLTQKEFAEKYNIPQRSVENWDAGSRNPPDYLVELLTRVVKEDFSLKL